MWHCSTFADHLKKESGEDLWTEKVQPAIKKAVLWSLQSVQDMVTNRKNSSELFGYDLMVDEHYNTWLIEINSSPSMDYSSSVTKKLVKEVLSDTVKVLVDYNMASWKRKALVKTGKYQLLHRAKGGVVEKAQNSFSLNLTVEGAAKKLQKLRPMR
mmetsp:Transcript_9776/g.10719  ORF Transcript_9776/g.10719 Transcript_9776/m.10719 type:complete len:156 (+) Transcript_9776:140-607(+)